MTSYIAKPFQGRELVARVHLQMQLGKRRAELEVSAHHYLVMVELMAFS